MRRALPVLTATTLALTGAFTATRLFGTGVMHALWRDPSVLASGQLWRLFTPVLVQSDPSAHTVIQVFALCAVVGIIGERVFSRPRWLALYVTGALVGQGIGEVFQPHQGGTSVAFVGVLGGLAAYAVLGPDARLRPLPLRVMAVAAVPAAIADTLVGDIHGLPFLAGVALASWWFLRQRDGELDNHALGEVAVAPDEGARVGDQCGERPRGSVVRFRSG
jgi:rhomboid protease GluP